MQGDTPCGLTCPSATVRLPWGTPPTPPQQGGRRTEHTRACTHTHTRWSHEVTTEPKRSLRLAMSQPPQPSGEKTVKRRGAGRGGGRGGDSLPGRGRGSDWRVLGTGSGTHGGSGGRDRESTGGKQKSRPEGPHWRAGGSKPRTQHRRVSGGREERAQGAVCPRGRKAASSTPRADGERGRSASRFLQSVRDGRPGKGAFKRQTGTLKGNVHTGQEPQRPRLDHQPHLPQHAVQVTRLGPVYAQRRASPCPYRRWR